MELREPLVGGGLGDATVVVRLSTDSVGKAGVAEPWIPCLARVCGVVGRRADFVGDGRAVGLRPEPLRVSAYRLPSLPQRQKATAAPVRKRTSAYCKARRRAPGPQSKACLLRRHSGLFTARKRAIKTGLRPASASAFAF